MGGSNYWWGGKADQDQQQDDHRGAASRSRWVATALSFDTAYGVETEWDFMWVQASEDGATWKTLTNANTTCDHDPRGGSAG